MDVTHSAVKYYWFPWCWGFKKIETQWSFPRNFVFNVLERSRILPTTDSSSTCCTSSERKSRNSWIDEARGHGLSGGGCWLSSMFLRYFVELGTHFSSWKQIVSVWTYEPTVRMVLQAVGMAGGGTEAGVNWVMTEEGRMHSGIRSREMNVWEGRIVVDHLFFFVVRGYNWGR